MKNVVILGGGYGGLTVATELLKEELPSDTCITLIDRMPFQGLKTEYYALAAGTLADIELRVAFPADERLNRKYGTVQSVNLADKQVYLAGGEIMGYDQLVIALGCTDKYHGIEGAEKFSCGIQSFSGARKTYQQVNDIKPYGQVTIVGGGLSGVEMAAELRESRPDLNIRILDRGPSILSTFPHKLVTYVREWFDEHDVEMKSFISLTRVEDGALYHQDQILKTDVTIWTAGIQPSPIVQTLDLPKDAQGRIILNAYHQIASFPEVYVVGDCASLPFSPSGQAAEAQGKQVAEVIQAIWKKETPKLGKIKLKGVLGSLGKKSGFGVMGKKTVMIGKVPRVLKGGVLWMSKRHFG